MEQAKQRSVRFGEYLVEHRATVRSTAAVFSVSKSTVHADMCEKLKYLDADLYEKVRKVLEHNLSVRHLRGGIATREKYKK